MCPMLHYCTTGVRNYHFKPIEIHTRHYWEFQFFLRGSCSPKFRKNKNMENIEGNFWIFRPDCPHGWKECLKKECEIAVFHFSEIPDILAQLFRCRQAMPIYLSNKQLNEVRNLAKEYSKEVIKPGAISPLRYRLCLDKLSLLFLEERNQINDLSLLSREKQVANAATAWFCSHMDEGPDIKRIAEKMGYDVSHLRRIFHKAAGETPNMIFTRHKMIRSAEMLISGNEQIINIALACGYNSHCSFTRAFRKYYSMSPIEFRKSNIPNYMEYLEKLKTI